MASRSRERRRRNVRIAGVWDSGLLPTMTSRAAVQHGARGGQVVGTRLVSGLIIVCLLAVLAMFIGSDAFYVHSIAVSGLQYLTKEEVFALTDIANMHIFWVDAAQVRAGILRSPTVADAEVQLGWPPLMVRIAIQERQPALVWEQAGVATWVDVQGRVMLMREDRPDLMRIVDIAAEGPLGPDVRVDVAAVVGALQLKSMYPNIERMLYHPDRGLGYQDGRGWEVWFGTGTDMPEKILVYNAIVGNLLARGKQPALLNVANPDAPYYSEVRGR